MLCDERLTIKLSDELCISILYTHKLEHARIHTMKPNPNNKINFPANGNGIDSDDVNDNHVQNQLKMSFDDGYILINWITI